MGRQGIKRTTKAVLLAGVIVASPIALALVLKVKGVNNLAPLAGFGTTSIANHWIPLAVLLSAASSWGVAQNYNLNSGGFVGVGVHRHASWVTRIRWRWRSPLPFTFLPVRYVPYERADPVRSGVLGDAADIVDDLVDAAVGRSIHLQCRVTNHLDLASMVLPPVRTRPTGQRHGLHQPAAGGGRSWVCRRRSSRRPCGGSNRSSTGHSLALAVG